MLDAITVIIFVVSNRSPCVKITGICDVLSRIDPRSELSKNLQIPCHPAVADDALPVWRLSFLTHL